MKTYFSKIRALTVRMAPAVVEVSIAINRVILLAYCNLTLAFIVLILENGGEHIKKSSRAVIVTALLVLIATAGWVYNSYAGGTQ